MERQMIPCYSQYRDCIIQQPSYAVAE